MYHDVNFLTRLNLSPLALFDVRLLAFALQVKVETPYCVEFLLCCSAN